MLNLMALAAHGLQVGELRCESLKDPDGIDVFTPRLSWIMEPEPQIRGLKQTAYEVMVASSAQLLAHNEGDLWSSGKIDSAESIQVRYAGKALRSLDGCYWKVRVWDNFGNASKWSPPGHWSMGLNEGWGAQWVGLDEEIAPLTYLKGAQWIWFPEGHPAVAAPVGARKFERTIVLPIGISVQKATCYLTGDDSAELFVNGNRVGAATDFHAAITLDMTALLNRLTNTIVIVGKNGGAAPNPAGVLAVLVVEFDRGKPLVVVTDGQWKTGKTMQDDCTENAQVLGAFGADPRGNVRLTDNVRRLPARWVRKEFVTGKKVRSAMICYSGLGWSELYLNGERIGNEVLSPALSDYTKRVFYVTHDVTHAIKAGNNAIGVVLGNGRFYAPRTSDPTATLTYGFPKLLLKLHIDYQDGSVSNIVSDESWALSADGPIRANNEYDGEEYDARKEFYGWTQPGFDASRWQKAKIVTAPAGKLSAPMLDPIRVTAYVKPLAITQPKPGVSIFDLGQNIAGWCRLRVSGRAGQQVRIRYAERLKSDGTLYQDNLRGAKVTDSYTLKGAGEEVYEPRFTLHGFRYVEITGYPGTPDPESILGCVVNDDLESAGEFKCSNLLLNRIYSNIVWGVRGNYRSIPTDCPQRDERQGWLGDRAAESLGEGYLFRHGALYAKWVRDMVDSQHDDGVVCDVCPAYWPLYNDSITWPGSFAIIPGSLYDLYADRDLLAGEYPAIVKWLDHHIGFIKDGISTRDHFGDWCVPPEDPKLIHSKDPARKTSGPLIATTYLYHCLKLGSRYASILGKSEDAKRFESAAQQLKDGLARDFFNPQRGYYDNGSATSCILPLAFGMTPSEEQPRVLDHLVNKIAIENRGHSCFGLIGGQWVYRVLSHNGQGNLAYTMASQSDYPSLGYMVEQGATTIWELWNGNTADPAMNSGNHVMLVGDLVVWLFQDVAGIAPDPDYPGFHHIMMRPTPVGDLQQASATHRSPYGLIASDWRKDQDGTFHWNVTVPPNTTATLCLPAKDLQSITESGAPAKSARGLKFIQLENGRAIFEAESGAFQLLARP
jgi:alpha-L-rhamnosidase